MGDIERAVPTENDPLNTGRSSSSSSSSSSSEPNSARPHHHHHHHHRNHKSQNVSVLGVIGVALTVCLFFFGSFMYIASSNSGSSPSARKYAEKVMIEKEIMLFGDSLVGVPETEYHMGESLEKEIEKAHPDYDAVISISFGNGGTASDLSSRVDEEVLNRKSTPNPPNALIISLDTDDVDADDEDKAHQVRSRYAEKLDAVLGKVKNKIKYVALSGPTLKGEKKDEDKKLDAYEEINQKLTKKHDVAYINLREKFLAEDNGYDGEAGHLTKDGERPEMKDEDIIEKAFKDQILSWDELFSGPTTRVNNFHAPPSLETLIKSLKAQHSHAECVKQAGEQRCEQLEKAMKAANELHMNTIQLESGEEIAFEDEEDVKTDPKSGEEVEEAIEMDRETHGTFKNVDYQKVKDLVKEEDRAAAEKLAEMKKDKKKNSKKLKSMK